MRERERKRNKRERERERERERGRERERDRERGAYTEMQTSHRKEVTDRYPDPTTHPYSYILYP